MSSVNSVAQQTQRFAFVGVLNSLFGYAAIFGALMLGASDYVANAIGYAFGLALAFVLQSKWVFAGSKVSNGLAGIRFLVAFAISYAINFAVIASARHLGYVDMPATHLAGMACYSISFFLLSRSFVFESGDSAPKTLLSQGALTDWLWRAFSVIAVVSYFVGMLFSPIGHDVGWQLWIGDQLSKGSRLYVDILEINPPLWFWMAQGFSNVASLFGLESRTVMIGVVIMWTAVSAAFVLRLLPAFPGARAFVVSLFFLIVAVSYPNFGQREHMALLAAIPYAVLIAQRRVGAQISLGLALAIGILAAAGFALKHYFVAIPVLLEIWLAAGRLRRGRYRALRPETIALGSLALLYAALVPWLTPEFFTVIVPLVSLAYHIWEVDWQFVLFAFSPIFAVVAVVLAFGMARDAHDRFEPAGQLRLLIVIALILVTIGFGASYVIQKKGWLYHGMPLLLAGIASLCAALFLGRGGAVRRICTYPLAGALIVFVIYFRMVGGAYGNPAKEYVDQMLDRLPRNAVVSSLSPEPMIAWPMVGERGYAWPHRHYAFWMLGAVVQNEKAGNPNPRLRELGNRLRHETAVELACKPPQLIIVDAVESRIGMEGGAFDYLSWMKQDALFADVFSRYKQVSVSDFGARSFMTDNLAKPLKSAECPYLP